MTFHVEVLVNEATSEWTTIGNRFGDPKRFETEGNAHLWISENAHDSRKYRVVEAKPGNVQLPMNLVVTCASCQREIRRETVEQFSPGHLDRFDERAKKTGDDADKDPWFCSAACLVRYGVTHKDIGVPR